MRRVAGAEANRRGSRAVLRGRHSSSTARSRYRTPPMLRMPPQWGTRDVELLLEMLWGMFTESQARRLEVTVPWDDSEEPRRMALADLAALMESWIG